MKQWILTTGAVALSLALAACGDDKKNEGNGGGGQGMAQTPENMCTSPGGALGYVDKIDDGLVEAIKANKLDPAKAQEYMKVVADESEKARASNDWVGFCKTVEAKIKALGY